MGLIVGCSKCDAKFKVVDNKAGKKMKCARCGGIVAIPAAESTSLSKSASSEHRTATSELTCPNCDAKFVPRLPRPGNPLRCPHCKEVHPSSPYAESSAEKRSRAADGKRGPKCPGCNRTLSIHATYCTACDRNVGVHKEFVHSGYSDREDTRIRRLNATVGLLEFIGRTLLIIYLLITFRWGRLLDYLHSD